MDIIDNNCKSILNVSTHLKGNTFTLSEALDMDEIAKNQYNYYPNLYNAQTGNRVSIGRIKCTPRILTKPDPIPEKYKPKKY